MITYVIQISCLQSYNGYTFSLFIVEKITISGADPEGEGAHPARAPLKLEKI